MSRGVETLVARHLSIIAAFASFAGAQTTYHVVQGNVGEDWPYDNWGNAAADIQTAINASSAAGDIILVSNGLYNTGGTIAPSQAVTSRVVVSAGRILKSLHGPAVTTIEGSGGSVGPDAVRGVYLASGAQLIGFTVQNGRSHNAVSGPDRQGGGVYCVDVSAIVSNCVIRNNESHQQGGGLMYGTFYGCAFYTNNCLGSTGAGGAQGSTGYGSLFLGNTAARGPSSGCTLWYCTNMLNTATSYGGGAYGGTLHHCMIISNSAGTGGGGAESATAYSTVFRGNTAGSYGGGARYGTYYNCLFVGNEQTSGSTGTRGGGGCWDSVLYNCTVVGNRARNAANGGGGLYDSIATNTIVYYNSADVGANSNTYLGTFGYSCVEPVPAGEGNKAGPPSFVDQGNGYGQTMTEGDYRLQPDSPAMDAGLEFDWMTDTEDPRHVDILGQERIAFSAVDMGAYECVASAGGTLFFFR